MSQGFGLVPTATAHKLTAAQSVKHEAMVRDESLAFLRKLKAEEDRKTHLQAQKLAATDMSKSVYLRVSDTGRRAALAAGKFRHVDSVELHSASDTLHMHRIEPAPGPADQIRMHDICVLLSHGITSLGDVSLIMSQRIVRLRELQQELQQAVMTRAEEERAAEQVNFDWENTLVVEVATAPPVPMGRKFRD